MKVLELKGIRSLRALNAFHTLMLGLKMLPAYAMETYEQFYARIETMDDAGQETMIREAAVFVPLTDEDVEAVISFCADPNGVPIGAANVKNLGPKEIHECVVAVCKVIGRIKIDLVADAQKKN